MAKHKMLEHLDEIGMSAATASGLIDLTQSAISRIISKRLPPNLRSAARIVAASDGAITYEDLLPAADRRKLAKYKGRLTAAYTKGSGSSDG